MIKIEGYWILVEQAHCHFLYNDILIVFIPGEISTNNS